MIVIGRPFFHFIILCFFLFIFFQMLSFPIIYHFFPPDDMFFGSTSIIRVNQYINQSIHVYVCGRKITHEGEKKMAKSK